uniref:Uncharacterized protein n=1 Tax=Ciona intestinalis TaxID=7719 RepID=H2XTX5_CIOIN
MGVSDIFLYSIFSSHLVVNKEHSRNYKTVFSRLPYTVVNCLKRDLDILILCAKGVPSSLTLLCRPKNI